MRTARSWASALALMCGWGCGDPAQSDTSLLDAPAADGSWAAFEGRGPICSTCLLGGGESSDFDGGSITMCPDLIRPERVSEADVQAAGWDTAAFRQLVERSFESELRWTDLTSSTALPRAEAIAGFQAETRIRGAVTLDGSWQRLGMDPAWCVGNVCTLGGLVEDCSTWLDGRFFSGVSVTLQTQDGALDTTLSGRAWLDPPPSPAEASWRGQLAFVASRDIADVEGMLRIEPLPDARYGQLRLDLSYFESGVRGGLSVNFTNRARAGTGQGPIDEIPLAAKFPADACSERIQPTPLASPHPLLMQRTPGAMLDELRAVIGVAGAAGRWLQTGGDVRIDVDPGIPEYACVNAWPANDGIAGQITNVPVRLRTSDGLLDWTVDAVYRFNARPDVMAHQLAFDRRYVPTAPLLSERLGAFTFPPHSTQRTVSLRGNFPVSAQAEAASGLVLRVTSPADCAGNDRPCSDAYRTAYVEQCLVAPAGASCVVPPQVDWTLPASP